VRIVAASQSLLGSESDVMLPVVKPTRVLPFVAAGLLAVVAAVVIVVTMREPAKPAVSAASAAAPASALPSSVTTTTSEPPAAPEAPVAEEVKVRIDGTPAGAIVSADGKELGAAPGPFTMKNGAETKLVVTAKGYKTKELTVKPAPDLVVNVALDRQAGGGAAGKSGPGKGKGIHSDLEGFDSK
jgi:hypothetical protein